MFWVQNATVTGSPSTLSLDLTMYPFILEYVIRCLDRCGHNLKINEGNAFMNYRNETIYLVRTKSDDGTFTDEVEIRSE